MKKIPEMPAPKEVDRLARDLVDRVNLYIEDTTDGPQIMGALNALAATVAFFLVASRIKGFKDTSDAWAKILPRHVQGMERLFESCKQDKEEQK